MLNRFQEVRYLKKMEENEKNKNFAGSFGEKSVKIFLFYRDTFYTIYF